MDVLAQTQQNSGRLSGRGHQSGADHGARGSLCYFLIEVFFRGPTVGSVRWVMFWFVMAVVLVARIGIEESPGRAVVFGLGLVVATWLYLLTVSPAFVLGMILLGIVWWCAHKLT